MSEIFVDYEWGNLREIFIGMPHMLYPDMERAAWLQKAVEVLPKSEADQYLARSGKSGRELGKFDLMEAECEELIPTLRNFDSPRL